MYKPLPPYLTIKNSTIEGLGLFTLEDIDDNFTIGITHVRNDNFPDGYVRTPLGGFFNHSATPNCLVVYVEDYIKLKTLRKINAGEELTATYTLYNPDEKSPT
jgi:SET domain-containing protein